MSDFMPFRLATKRRDAVTIETEWRDYDVVVVGSGGAGSMAAPRQKG